MNKLLVTGAGGFLGSAVCQAAFSTWQVYGVVFSHSVALDPHTVFRVDLTQPREVKHVMDSILPHAVIHTATMADPNACQANPAQSGKINVDAAVFMAKWCADHDIPMVFTSSDLVFDGQNAPYRESDPVNPVNLYGEQKARAEAEILRVYPEAAVCRLSLMFGDKPSARYQPLTILLKQGRKIRLFVDEVRTPFDVYTAAEGILLAAWEIKRPASPGWGGAHHPLSVRAASVRCSEYCNRRHCPLFSEGYPHGNCQTG